MRVFLAVHLPKLSLEVFLPRWLPEPASGSAVLEKDKVVVADRAARMAGVHPGMKRGGVTTLSPETKMYERDFVRETAAQREVGMALMRFSPDVALLDEATVIVEVGASLRLFGGLLSLCRQAKAMLATLGLTARISAAPTGQGAWLLAKHGRANAGAYCSSPRSSACCYRCPCSRCRKSVRSPTGLPGLAARRSLTYAVCLAPVCSAAAANICWIRWIALSAPRRSCSTGSSLPPTFSARIELPDRLEHADGALFAAHRLIVQLCGWLCAKQLAVTALTLSIEHERGRQALPPTLIEIALGEPSMA